MGLSLGYLVACMTHGIFDNCALLAFGVVGLGAAIEIGLNDAPAKNRQGRLAPPLARSCGALRGEQLAGFLGQGSYRHEVLFFITSRSSPAPKKSQGTWTTTRAPPAPAPASYPPTLLDGSGPPTSQVPLVYLGLGEPPEYSGSGLHLAFWRLAVAGLLECAAEGLPAACRRICVKSGGGLTQEPLAERGQDLPKCGVASTS